MSCYEKYNEIIQELNPIFNKLEIFKDFKEKYVNNNFVNKNAFSDSKNYNDREIFVNLEILFLKYKYDTFNNIYNKKCCMYGGGLTFKEFQTLLDSLFEKNPDFSWQKFMIAFLVGFVLYNKITLEKDSWDKKLAEYIKIYIMNNLLKNINNINNLESFHNYLKTLRIEFMKVENCKENNKILNIIFSKF